MLTAFVIVVVQDADNMKKGLLKNSTLRISFCGIISALSIVLMLLTAIIPVGTYAIPAIAGVLITMVVIEYGCKWATSVYIVVSILSLFFVLDKEAASYYILLFGYYPIIKAIFEYRIKNKFVQYVLKFAVFNVAVISAFYIGIFLLGIKPEEYSLFGVYLPMVFLLAGNIFFIFYDILITSFVIKYVRNLRKLLFKKK